MTVYLLRHAMPALDHALPPDRWHLTDEGRTAAASLRNRLPRNALRLTSDEVKAQETLTLACPGAARVDHLLGEVRRPREPVGIDVVPTRRAWVAGRLDERHRGWEQPADAAARVDVALSEVVCTGRDLVVATHGMVLTAWLVAIGQVSAGEPAARFWESLRLPDVVVVDR